MKFITQLSRVFVGVLFIISGLIKLNDPTGFAFKLEEYFSEAVLNLPFLLPYALTLATTMVILEVVLGFALLLGYAKKLTLWLLFLLIVFFSFLTFYSAYFNKVTDCGCFGDAISLTPWQSFTKDIVLLIFILIIMRYQEVIKPIFHARVNTSIIIIVLVGCLFMGYWVLNHLPLKDFRAYKVGTNIIEGMEIPEDAPRAKYEITFYYMVDNIEKAFTDKELVNLPDGATFVRREDKLLEEGYTPPIHDFSMDKEGIDYTEEMMQEPKLMLLITYDLTKSAPKGLAILKDVANQAIIKGYKVVGLTASTEDLITSTIDQYELPFDYYTCDGTTLKTIERANPSIVILEHGVIVDKKHWKDIEKLNLK